MKGYMGKYKFSIMRRITQISIMLLFLAGSTYGWNVLKGNLSAAFLFGMIPLTDPYHISQMLVTLFIPTSEAFIGAVIVLAFYAVLAGRAFCGWVCPVNVVTDAANWLRKKLGINDTAQFSRGVRYWILGLSILLSFFLEVAAFEWISPVSMLHRGLVFGMGFGWIAVLSVFLFDLLITKNGFCGHICPLGGFYALVGRFNIIKPRYIHERCTICLKCIDICPEKQVLDTVGKKSSHILSGECINCGRCIEVCDDKAMIFSNRLH